MSCRLLRLIPVIMVIIAGTSLTGSLAEGKTEISSSILFKQGARTSRWSPLAQAQEQLELSSDGVFGERTHKALRLYQSRHKLPVTGNLDIKTWERLMDEPAPDVPVRAEQLTFAMEDTDFDDWEWNYPYDERDPSGATWGPAGLTIIHNEIQAVFKKISEDSPKLLPEVFGDLYPTVKSLMTKKDSAAKKYLKERIYNSSTKRRQWLRDIKQLAGYETAREAYLEYCRAHFLPGMKELDEAYPIKTELDYAFYWDLSIHTAGLTETRKAAIDRELKKAGKSFRTPAQRRAIIGKVFVDTLGNRSQKRSRTQRNLLFIEGKSTVHGRKLDCAWYGLGERDYEFDEK